MQLRVPASCGAAKLSLGMVLLLGMGCRGQTPGELAGPGPATMYNSGYLVSWNSPEYTEVTVFGRKAEPIYAVNERKGKGSYHYAWAIDSDGVAARATQAEDAWEGRIELLDLHGNPMHTIKTGAYMPEHLAFGPDHSLWTVGCEAGNDGMSGTDFNVVRRYSRAGDELGRMLAWSEMASNLNSYTALQPLVGGRRFFVSKDRIGFTLLTGTGHPEWIEASLAGEIAGRYELGDVAGFSYQPVAMTDSGDVYAAIYKEQRRDGWALLDKSSRSWKKLAAYPEGQIIGSELNEVVFLSPGTHGAAEVRFVPAADLGIAGPVISRHAR